MKIEQLLVQYLYSTKVLTLQGIGTVQLDPSVQLPSENDKDFVMPEKAFTFIYDLKATEDEGLIDYIVLHTKKIKPLAQADLDSYIILAKQFLNIGKPLRMEGVGTIQKNQAGIYEFIPGVFITPKIDDFPKQIKDKSFDEVSFETERKPNNSSRNLMIVLAGVVAVLLFLGIYYLIFKRKKTEQVVPPKTTIVADTTRKDTIKKTTPDTTHAVPKPVIQKDSNNFTIVIKTFTTNDAAEKVHTKLSSYGHQLTVEKIDSTKFELGMNFKRNLSDTTKVRDSLKVFFGGTPSVKVKPQ